jgi:hypothetical protein
MLTTNNNCQPLYKYESSPPIFANPGGLCAEEFLRVVEHINRRPLLRYATQHGEPCDSELRVEDKDSL